LRWARVRNLIIMRKIAQTNDTPKLSSLKNILANGRHFDEILKLCVGSGKSLLRESVGENKDV
jgi:hypothetical protein